MKTRKLPRSNARTQTGSGIGTAVTAEKKGIAAAPPKPPLEKLKSLFRFCLNTATIRGQKLGIIKEIEIAAKAGYDGIEPWIGSIEDYVKSGGTVRDLK